MHGHVIIATTTEISQCRAGENVRRHAISALKVGVVNRSSSQGTIGEIRKSLGLKKSGDAEGDGTVREEVGEEEPLLLPDSAEAIAWAAASSSADIGRTVDGLPSVIAHVCSGV